MDRRRFLGLLGSTGLVAVSKKFWTLTNGGIFLPDTDLWDGDDELVGEPDLFVYNPPTYGPNQTYKVFALNDSRWDVGEVRLTRPDGNTLLVFRLGPGGMVQWQAAPGEEIMGPVRVVSPVHVSMQVGGTDPAGRPVSATKRATEVTTIPQSFRQAFAC